MISKQEAVQKMNQYAKASKPFVFISSFDTSKNLVLPLKKLKKHKIKLKCADFSNIDEHPLSETIVFHKFITERSTFGKAFNKVKQELSKGNSYLTNLTFKTPIDTNLTISKLSKVSRSKYKILYKDQFLSFSPESFVKIKDGNIYSYPMKGTIDASLPNAEEQIIADQKEMAEHTTIVDLIRNDISQIADHVEVTKFRYVDEITTHDKKLLQVSSEIKGKLRSGYQNTIGDIIFHMLPAGSISGAPKPETLRIIQETEDYERDFYTGVTGYFDGRNLDSFVMIRFVENKNGQLYFKSGGGITYLSEEEAEYQEMIDKIYVPID